MSSVRRALLAPVLVPLAVVALLAAAVAEVGGRTAIERVTAERLRESGIAGGVDVVVGASWWWPTLVPSLAGSRLDSVRVELREAHLAGLRVAVADYQLDGLEVAVSPRARTLGVTSVTRGHYRLLLDPTDLGEDLGVPARVDGGDLLVGADEMVATLEVDGDDLVVRSGGDGSGEVRLPVVDPYLLPCSPRVRIVIGMVELWCTAAELPGVLEEPLGGGDDGGPLDGEDLPAGPVELEPPATVELDGDRTSEGDPGG